mmetsp:Transcript_29787/g.55202  ORF Transcript_29787/g.55202 Transcript_29787/m.55202 type:complete len:277 (+) Transcript_29787:529-1359(+)
MSMARQCRQHRKLVLSIQNVHIAIGAAGNEDVFFMMQTQARHFSLPNLGLRLASNLHLHRSRVVELHLRHNLVHTQYERATVSLERDVADRLTHIKDLYRNGISRIPELQESIKSTSDDDIGICGMSSHSDVSQTHVSLRDQHHCTGINRNLQHGRVAYSDEQSLKDGVGVDGSHVGPVKHVVDQCHAFRQIEKFQLLQRIGPHFNAITGRAHESTRGKSHTSSISEFGQGRNSAGMRALNGLIQRFPLPHAEGTLRISSDEVARSIGNHGSDFAI